MRALTKGDEPAVLARNAARWTESFVSTGGTSRPWAHEDIKAALVQETDGKCAYCEARLLHVMFGDIEHILPKSTRPDLVVSWSNLTLICGRCNQSKSDKSDEVLTFVNPYIDEISEHLLVAGPVVFGVSDRGDYTIDNLGLNEPARIAARERIIRQAEALTRLRNLATGYVRERLDNELDELKERGEYTAAVASYLARRPPRRREDDAA